MKAKLEGKPLRKPSTSSEDLTILEALRSGNEEVFTSIVEKYYSSLLRLAMAYVPSRAVAEEVVQETWMGVFEGLSRFEGRSSLKTWIFRILTNRAKTRGIRESRYESTNTSDNLRNDQEDLTFGSHSFIKSGPRVDHWATPPGVWDEKTPERLLLSKESRRLINKAIQTLPPTQRQVITLRDIEELTSQEVCNILDISETNQRVLLHRARTRIRRVLGEYLKQV